MITILIKIIAKRIPYKNCLWKRCKLCKLLSNGQLWIYGWSLSISSYHQWKNAQTKQIGQPCSLTSLSFFHFTFFTFTFPPYPFSLAFVATTWYGGSPRPVCNRGHGRSPHPLSYPQVQYPLPRSLLCPEWVEWRLASCGTSHFFVVEYAWLFGHGARTIDLPFE